MEYADVVTWVSVNKTSKQVLNKHSDPHGFLFVSSLSCEC